MNETQIRQEKFAERLDKLMKQYNRTIDDLADHLGLHRSTISRYKNAQMSPKITAIKEMARYFNINPAWLMGYDVDKKLDHQEGYKLVPEVGCIAAGQPVLSEENIRGYRRVPQNDIDNAEYLFLEVKGDSMINAGIREGDLALIRVQPEVKHREIAAVLIDKEEATLKRVLKLDDKIVLQPENPNYDPIVIDGREIEIIGKLVKIIRDY